MKFHVPVGPYGSDVSVDLAHPVDDEFDELARRYLALSDKRYRPYKIAVVTALPKESAAVHAALGPGTKLYHELSDMGYTLFEVPAAQPGTTHKVVLVQAPKMGNSSSAIAAYSAIKDFRGIEDVIMVGIAGGIPDLKHHELDVRVGDIVVSSGKGLIQYDMQKVEDRKRTVRSIHSQPSAFLLTSVNDLEVDRRAQGHKPWMRHLAAPSALEGNGRPADKSDVMMKKRTYDDATDERRRRGEPVVHLGVVASANSLLKSAGKRDKLRKDFGALAVEMEGSGVGDATWFSGKGYLIVRGICDYCDPDKNDVWQGYAAAAAAGYLRALLEATRNREDR